MCATYQGANCRKDYPGGDPEKSETMMELTDSFISTSSHVMCKRTTHRDQIWSRVKTHFEKKMSLTEFCNDIYMY